MAGYITTQQANTGSFVPTTNALDVQRVYATSVTSPEFKDLIANLFRVINEININLNVKVAGYRLEEEFLSGKLYFNPNSTNPLDLRPSYYKMINTGAIGAGITNIPHGLTIGSTWTFVQTTGELTNTTTNNIYPLPFVGVAGNNIEMRLNATNLVINNASGAVFERGLVLIEFIKN